MIPGALLAPAVLVLKERPLDGGPHRRLYATWTPSSSRQRKPRPNDGCAIWCSCGERVAVSIVSQFQRALDGAARWHGPDAPYRRALAGALGLDE